MSPRQVFVILWRRLWIVALTFASTLAGAGGVFVLVPARYDAVATASIDPGQGDPINGQLLAGGGAAALLQGNLTALAKSQRVALEVVKRLGLDRDPNSIADYHAAEAAGRVDIDEWLAAEIIKNIDAKFAIGTNVLTLTERSSSPIEGALVANAFMSAFIDAAVEMKVSAAQQTAQWFAPQMEKLRTELNAARDRLSQFQREANLLAPNASGDSDTSQLMAVTTELSTAKGDLATLESRLQARPAQDAGDIVAAPSDAADPDAQALAALKTKVSDVTTEIGRLQAELGANNPKLSAQVATLRSLQEQVRSEAASARGKLAARVEQKKSEVQALEDAHAKAQQRMIEMQAQRDRMAAMTREVEFRQDQLEAASKAAGEARLRSQLSFSNISKIDVATPPVDPAFPKPILVAIAGVGLGLALGIILAFLGESFDRRIRVLSDLDFAASIPVLGTLANGATLRWGRARDGGGELARLGV